MTIDKLLTYLTVATNISVVVGLLLVLVQLRQNNANLITANEWALAQSSAAVWQALVESEDLARIELKVGRREALSEVDSVRYSAYIWTRLEQVWSAYELHDRNVLSDAEWRGIYTPTQLRAAAYPIAASAIRNGPMPAPLKGLLLAKVAPGR